MTGLPALLSANFVLPPFDHQFEEFEFHCEDEARALAWTMRCGKTKEVIDKACHLYARALKADGVLIFAPNGVHANWTEVEFPKHCWRDVKFNALTWRSADLSKKKKVPKSQIEAFNKERQAWVDKLKRAKNSPNLMVLAIPTEVMIREDVRKVIKFFFQHRRVLVVFDESDDWGTPGSKRTKMARALGPRCAFRMILSGTMLTGSPLAAFSQFELLEHHALGFDTYEKFKDHYCEMEMAFGAGGRQFPRVASFKNLDDLRERMSRFMSVVTREQANLPPLNIEPREIEPTPEQLKAYRDLKTRITTEIRNKDISIGELAGKMQKLQQVFSGFVIDEYKEVHRIPGGNPRLDLLLREVYLAPGKVIIWCQFQEDIDNVVAALFLEGYEVAEYHGRVTGQGKTDSLRNFVSKREIKPLVGHPQTGGRGLDMSAASKIINYSHTIKARLRQQSLERASKSGGGNVQVLDFIAGGKLGPDQRIIDITEGRINMNDYLTGTGMRDLLKGLEL